MDYIWAFVARYNFYSNFGKVGTRLERSAVNQVIQNKKKKMKKVAIWKVEAEQRQDLGQLCYASWSSHNFWKAIGL